MPDFEMLALHLYLADDRVIYFLRQGKVWFIRNCEEHSDEAICEYLFLNYEMVALRSQ